MDEQKKLFEKEFDDREYNILIFNILSKRMHNLFTNINNALSNTINIKKSLNATTKSISHSKRAKRE